MRNEDALTYQAKTPGDLLREALRFVLHTLFAVLTLVAIVAAFQLLHADPEAVAPKYLATLFAFLVPLLAGLTVARLRYDPAAAYTWVAGLLFFAAISVAVLDLPTGPGLCQGCDASHKLTRTFFSFKNGSGLLGGDGVLVGVWVPFALIGYAAGTRLSRRTAAAASADTAPK